MGNFSNSSPSLLALLHLNSGDMISVMGAGGKATFMKRLVIELVEAGKPVLVTATTNLHSLGDWSGPSLLLGEKEREKASNAAKVWAGRGAVVWVEKKLPGKMFQGIPIGQVEELHRQSEENIFIVKTDGARKRCIKAPSDTEPLIPECSSHCIVVLGLNAIGRRAEPGIVHRFERACKIGGFQEGQIIEPSHLLALASHPNSYPHRFPAGVKRGLYLSHCTSEIQYAMAEEIWNSIPSGMYDFLLAGDTVEGKFFLGGYGN